MSNCKEYNHCYCSLWVLPWSMLTHQQFYSPLCLHHHCKCQPCKNSKWYSNVVLEVGLTLNFRNLQYSMGTHWETMMYIMTPISCKKLWRDVHNNHLKEFSTSVLLCECLTDAIGTYIQWISFLDITEVYKPFQKLIFNWKINAVYILGAHDVLIYVDVI